MNMLQLKFHFHFDWREESIIVVKKNNGIIILTIFNKKNTNKINTITVTILVDKNIVQLTIILYGFLKISNVIQSK